MDQRERQIGARLKEFREGINFSQPSFAKLIGLTRDQLASIEYGRTPMRYSIAWDIRHTFGLSVDWLWGGDMPPDDLSEDADLPHPRAPGIEKQALLTEVFKKHYKLEESADRTLRVQKKPKIKVDAGHRWFITLVLSHEADEWVANVPDGYTVDFCDKLRLYARRYLDALPKDSEELIAARFEAIRWEQMRAAIAKRKLTGKGWEKQDLTLTSNSGKAGEVKAQLPRFLARLNKASTAPGKKTELANFLGVPLESVSRWLSGAREPGAENTLRLLQWVEQQERQK